MPSDESRASAPFTFVESTSRGRRLHARRYRLGLSIVQQIVPLAALGALVAVRIWDPVPVEALRLQGLDLYQRVAPRQAAAQPVQVVDIDDATLAVEGQWPWPRTLVARLVARLSEMGAVVVGFDVIFAEPDRMSPRSLADDLPGLDEQARAILRDVPSNDAVLAEALARTRVVLAQAPVAQPRGDLDTSRPVMTAVAEVGGDPRPHLFAYEGVIRNIPVLERAAKGLGGITINPEADGVARRVPLIVTAGGHIVPALAIEMLRVATGQNAIAVKSNAAGIDSIVVAGAAIPTDGHGRKWIHFAPYDPARSVSAKDVLSGDVDPARVRGKLVLVGTSATSLGDVRATPVSAAMPGVEVHAQLLETILSKSDLVRPNYTLGAELALLVLSGLIIMVLTPWVGAGWTLAVGAGVVTGLGAGSWYLFSAKSMLFDVSYSALGGLAIYSLVTSMRYMREASGRKMIRRAFAQYLSPIVIDRLAEHPEQLRLGGEIRDMTVLFADVQDFTAISERLSAEDLTSLMNRVLTRMTTPILHYHGTIDKYIGDSVMAFWNAPLVDPRHARNACLAALQMHREIEVLNDELQKEAEANGRKHMPIAIKIGLNSGQCAVGNLGSAQHFNYSVMGDVVNLSSRLEEQGRFYGCPIIVGETTAAEAGDLAFLEFDLIRVKGKQVPVHVFALLGDNSMLGTDGFAELCRVNGQLLEAYRAGDWTAAARALAWCRANVGDLPLGRVYAIYEERLSTRPALTNVTEWDGIYEAFQK